LVGKPEKKRILGRPRHRWEDNVSLDLREIVWKDVDLMHLGQDRDLMAGSSEHSNGTSGCIGSGEFH
jgi:hypothetical protein